MRRGLRIMLLASLPATCLAAVTATAEMRLSPERQFISPLDPRGPSWTTVDVNDRGDAVAGAVLRRRGGTTLVLVRTRTGARGAWTPPNVFGPFDARTSGPQVALNESGRAITTFTGNGRIYTSTRPVGGSWTAPSLVGAGRGARDRLMIELGDDGAAVIAAATHEAACVPPTDFECVWTMTTYRQASRLTAWQRGSGEVSTARTSTPPQLAIGPGGDAAFAWWAPGSPGQVVVALSRPGQLGVEPPTIVGSAGTGSVVRVGVGPNARALVAWTDPGSSGIHGTMWMARRHGTGSWDPPMSLGDAYTYNRFVVAVGATGRSAIAWSRPSSSGDELMVAEHAAGSASGSITVAATRQVVPYALDVHASDTTLVWGRTDSPTDLTAGSLSTRRAGAAWIVRGRLGTVVNPDTIAFSPTGAMIALGWTPSLSVRNYDSTTTPPAPSIGPIAATIRGRYRVLTFRTDTTGTLELTRLNVGKPIVRYVPTRRGVNQVTVGPLRAGTFPSFELRVCDSRRGCSPARSRTFRPR